MNHPQAMHEKTRRSSAGALLALILGVGAIGSPGESKSATVRVETMAALQAAVQGARAGDTVLVGEGRYEGNLLIRRKLALIGTMRSVIHGSGSGSVITIEADSCLLRGLVIEHSGPMLVDEDAGILLKSSGNTVEHCELRDVLFGIYLLHAEYNCVAHNRITGRKELDLGERGSGIHVWNSRGNRFLGNSITDARDGLYIQNAAQSRIEENEVFNLRYGLHYMYADSNVFLRNAFHDNVAGAAIMYSRGIRMYHNAFTHNRGFASFGILFQDCHDLEADSNVIADNVVGMFFEASTANRFSSNIIAQNDVALQMFQNSTGNTFTRNAFVDNLSPLEIIGKRTETSWSERGVGNYWSSYDGYDLDGDGVGDVPMKILDVFQYVQSRNRNLRLYLSSPSTLALEAATKAFPVLAVNAECDPAPLMHAPNVDRWPATSLLPEGARGERSSALSAIAPIIIAILCGGVYHRLSRRDA